MNMYLLFCILLLYIAERTGLGSQAPLSVAVLHLAQYEAREPGDCPSSFNHADFSEFKVRLGLVHVDSICSPFRRKNATVSVTTLDRLRADSFRSSYLKSESVAKGANSDTAAVNTPIASGVNIGTLNYITKLRIGTPARDFLVVVDTGSDVAWVQCVPCLYCYKQVDAYFDSSKSISYEKLTCNSPQCNKLPSKSRACSNTGDCLYELLYGDSSISEGNFALESFIVGGKMIEKYAFGCGRINGGLFQGADGLLGLGKGQLSFVSQTMSIFNGRFAYCLPSSSSSSGGFLEFGQTQKSIVTPIISYSAFPSFYFVSVKQITLGKRSLPISTAFTAIIDTGTVITRLPSPIYVAARDVFRKATSSLPPAASPLPSFLDTCYDLSSFKATAISIPLLSFHLDNGLVFTVPSKGMLIQLDKAAGTFCFAFAEAGNSDLGIIGNTQQQGFTFAFDLQDSTLSIQPGACS